LVAAASWRIVRTVPLPLPPYALAVDQRRGHVVALTSESLSASVPAGQVQVLDGRTGRLLHTVAMAAGASAMALDARSGHVYVANSYGTPASPGGLSRLVAWGRSWLPAWGPRWLARLAQTSPSLRTQPGTVTVLDPSRL
jgi:hypothetical protein